jgi:DNA primase
MPLYGAERLAARPYEPVIVCEGEKATQALLDAGYLAVGTVTGASSAPNAAVLAVLVGREVLLWPDHYTPGLAHMLRIARTLGAMKGA